MRSPKGHGTSVILIFIGILYSISVSAATETTSFGRFGQVYLYRAVEHPSHVALLVSGDGGWKLGVVGMAQQLSTLDTLVVGIDIRRYLKSLESSQDSCSYPTGDFEELSRFVQDELGYSDYVRPLLVGYSSGATLVYATLIQAPPGTFSGAISLGFCPDLPLTKTMCEGNGLQWATQPNHKGVIFLPSNNLTSPWIVMQGTTDQVCDPAATQTYVRQVSQSELVLLPKVGHGYAVKRNWWPQFRSAFSQIFVTQGNTGSETSRPGLGPAQHVSTSSGTRSMR